MKAFIKDECTKNNVTLPDKYDILDIPLDGVYISDKLDKIKEIAIKHGGQCLSESWLGNITPHKFKCVKNHTWEARPNDIKRGHWCPKCRKK